MLNRLLITLVICCCLPPVAVAASPDSVITREEAIRRQMENQPRWLLTGKGGFSYRIAKLPNGLSAFEKEYYTDLKSGYYYEFSAGYYLKNGIGFSAFYEAFKSSNEIKSVTVRFNNGVVATGVVSDDITISFYGPAVNYRRFNKNNNGFLNVSIGLGAMEYENTAMVIDKYIITGRTFGIGWAGSYYISLSPEVWLGLNLGYYSGLLSEYEIDDGTAKQSVNLGDNAEGLQHLNIGLTAGIAF